MDTNVGTEPGRVLFPQEVHAVVGAAMEVIGDLERGQVLSYLRALGLRVGVLLNFKHPKLEWERLVL